MTFLNPNNKGHLTNTAESGFVVPPFPSLGDSPPAPLPLFHLPPGKTFCTCCLHLIVGPAPKTSSLHANSVFGVLRTDACTAKPQVLGRESSQGTVSRQETAFSPVFLEIFLDTVLLHFKVGVDFRSEPEPVFRVQAICYRE